MAAIDQNATFRLTRRNGRFCRNSPAWRSPPIRLRGSTSTGSGATAPAIMRPPTARRTTARAATASRACDPPAAGWPHCPGMPAMSVEIACTYQPIISDYIALGDPIQEIATVLVRDNRDTSGPGINPVSPGLLLRTA